MQAPHISGQQGADREIEPRRVAVARDQVSVEDPLIQPAEKSGATDQPADRAAGIAPGGEVADQAERHQEQEADVNAAHHLARKIVEGRDIELERREHDADAVSEVSPGARAKTFRESVLEIVELDLDGRLSVHSLQHFLSFPSTRIQRRRYTIDDRPWAAQCAKKLNSPKKAEWPGLPATAREVPSARRVVTAYLIRPFSL
jgi:hypothetical protein